MKNAEAAEVEAHVENMLREIHTLTGCLVQKARDDAAEIAILQEAVAEEAKQ